MKQTQVYIRKEDDFKKVYISSENKPFIDDEFEKKWQRILDLVAKLVKVPAALLMSIKDDRMEVFLKSSNRENPYQVGGSDSLGHGLYCETVIGTNQELLVGNALEDDLWKNNPDVKLNMISYYGLPIHWPDHEFFGTICVLDNETNYYNNDVKLLMDEFRLSIEKDLELLSINKELKLQALMDPLTMLYNRRHCNETLKNEFDRSGRTKDPFSISFIDLDHFKKINDTYGHDIGDVVLKCFAKTLKSRIRSIDFLCRWGGDEFILICPNTKLIGIETLIKNTFDDVVEQIQAIVPFADFSYGCAEFEPSDTKYESMIRRADQQMFLQKKQKYKA